MHKATVRLTDEAWAPFEQVLAANNITLTAWLEATARVVGAAGAANGFQPFELWTTEVDVVTAPAEFIALARSIDVQRRARGRSDDEDDVDTV